MPDTAIDPVPKQEKFRRARLHRLRLHPRPHRRLGAGTGTAKGRVAPKPGGEFRRCSPRRRRQPRTLTAASGAVVISKAEEVMRLTELPEADGEAGGVLLGRYRGPHIEIMNCTTPLPEDLRTRFSFVWQDKGHQKAAIKEWLESGGSINFVGEWHTHPERF